ncbi:transposase [Micromonospora tulbaghiae]|uniref:transposase n=1 Tax=Micromonospora tulbaghiae TaxID=479978 RepID=UPI0013C529BF
MTADSGHGDCTRFRLGLAERGLQHVVQVDSTAHPGAAARGTPPTPAGAIHPPRLPAPPATRRAIAPAALSNSRNSAGASKHDYRNSNRPRHRPLRRPQPHRLAPARRRPGQAFCALRHLASKAYAPARRLARQIQQLLTGMACACHTCSRPCHDTTLTKHS